MNYTVDASVIAKWFIEEDYSGSARTILESDGLLVAPAHALAEVGEVLIRAFRNARIGERQLYEASLALPNSFAVVPLEEIFHASLEIARLVDVSVYDALYVATAERWNATLVTADRKLFERCTERYTRVRVVNLSRFL